MAFIDFTDAPIDLSTKYGGSDQKRGVLYNGSRYMIKMADRIPDDKRNAMNSSYYNSAFSEYICCHIIASMGIPVQETLLGIMTVTSSRTGELREHPVVACKNFLKPNEELIEFKVIENALLDRKPGKTPHIDDIYSIMLTDNAYFTREFGEEAMERYWDTFVLDALFGNFDRHSNNWGYIVNKDTREISLAPIYDCGSCLYPQVADTGIPEILSNEEEIQKRIDVYPNAALLENGKKVSYRMYINSLSNEDCNDAILRICPRIDFDKINEIIDSIDELTDIHKEFYKTMLHERYVQILEPAYEQLINREQLLNELLNDEELDATGLNITADYDSENYDPSDNM